MDTVKIHFENEAAAFDALVPKLIPYYGEMLDALVAAIPFDPEAALNVIDLGCGTGSLALRLKERFPAARVTCLDLAENMIAAARAKLAAFPDVTYVTGDAASYPFRDEYDVVLSSLALHHLATDEEKKAVYRKIFRNLTENGVFYTADTVLGSNENLQHLYLRRWKEYMERSIPREEVEGKWMQSYYTEDRPAKLTDHLRWLSEVGFRDVDVLWKQCGFAVFGGLKAY